MTRPSRDISLAVEGGCDVGVNSAFLRQTQALPGWIYSTSLLLTPAEPLLHKKWGNCLDRLWRNRSSFLSWCGHVIHSWMLSNNSQLPHTGSSWAISLAYTDKLVCWLNSKIKMQHKTFFCISMRSYSSRSQRHKGSEKDEYLLTYKLISRQNDILWSLCSRSGLRHAY